MRLTSGALTQPVTPAPEPSSVALMLLGVGLVFVMRKRIGQRLPQAISSAAGRCYIPHTAERPPFLASNVLPNAPQDFPPGRICIFPQ